MIKFLLILNKKCESFSTFSRFYLVLDLKHLLWSPCFSPNPSTKRHPKWSRRFRESLLSTAACKMKGTELDSTLGHLVGRGWGIVEKDGGGGGRAVAVWEDEEVLQLWCSTLLRKKGDCHRWISGHSGCCLQLGTGRWRGLMFGFLWLLSPGPLLPWGIASCKREMEFLVSSPCKDQATLSCFYGLIDSD